MTETERLEATEPPIRRRMRLKREHWVVAIVATLAATFFCLPLLANLSNWGILDWDQHLIYNGSPRRSILEYHEMPLWNPFYCGGMVDLANPQSPFLTPSYGFVLLFGEVAGLKLQIWFHFLFGLVGMYLLARRFRIDPIAAWLPAVVYMFSVNPWPFAAGMISLNLSVALLPWAFLLFEKGFGAPRFSIMAAFFLAFMLLGGGIYVLVMTCLFFVVYAAATGAHYGWRATIRNLVVVFTLAVLLSAVKLAPTFEFIDTYPRDITSRSGYTVESLTFSLFSRDQSYAARSGFDLPIDAFRGMIFTMDENGMYAGLVPFLFVFFGIIRARDARRWALLQVAVIFVWISFGHNLDFSLWAGLKALPVMESMRVAQRYRNVFMLVLALFAGMGLQLMAYRLRTRWRRKQLGTAFAVAVLLFVFIDVTLVQGPVLWAAMDGSPEEVEREAEYFQRWAFPTRGPGEMYPLFLANLGVINCYEPLKGPVFAVGRESEQYRGEVFLAGAPGTVELLEWSPNRIVVEVRAMGQGTLVLNQNGYPGWRAIDRTASVRRPLRDWEGLVAVDVSSPYQVIEFRYLPASFVAGLGVSVATLLLLLAGVLISATRKARRPHSSSAS